MLIKKYFLVILCGFALLHSQPLHKKAIIIGIDGLRPDALKKAHTPQMDKLIENGIVSYTAQTGDITLSGPGWSSMLTGVWRNKHRVETNKFEVSKFDLYPHFFARIKQVNPDIFTASVVHWGPIHKRIVSGADISLKYRSDDEVMQESQKILQEKNPDVMFIHFDDVDHAGHEYGFSPKLPKYIKAIENIDEKVGKIIASIEGRKTYPKEDWLVIVSTDHGGFLTGHGSDIPENRTIFVIVSGPSSQRGNFDIPIEIVDIPVTVLVYLGIKIDPKWDLDGKAVGLRK